MRWLGTLFSCCWFSSVCTRTHLTPFFMPLSFSASAGAAVASCPPSAVRALGVPCVRCACDVFGESGVRGVPGVGRAARVAAARDTSSVISAKGLFVTLLGRCQSQRHKVRQLPAAPPNNSSGPAAVVAHTAVRLVWVQGGSWASRRMDRALHGWALALDTVAGTLWCSLFRASLSPSTPLSHYPTLSVSPPSLCRCVRARACVDVYCHTGSPWRSVLCSEINAR